MKVVKLNNSGFSLIEVMIAVGIMAIMSLSTASLYNTMNTQSAYVDTKMDRQSLQAQIQNMLSRPASCRTNFAANFGFVPNYSVTALREYDDAGNYVASIVPSLNNPISPNSKVVVSQIEILGPGATGTPVLLGQTGMQKNYLADLRVSFATSVGGGVQMKPLIFSSISITKSLSDSFMGCQLVPAFPAATVCAQLGMDWDSGTSICTPTLASSCAKLGGTVVAGACVLANTQSTSCPSGQAVTGFSATGGVICSDFVAAATPTPAPAPVCRNVLNCFCYVAQPGGGLTCNMDIPTCYSYSRVCD